LFTQLVSKIFNLCGHDPPTSQTDRRADRQTTCDSKTALCAIVHCAVKTNLRRASNLAPLPELQMLQSFQLQGVLSPGSPPAHAHQGHTAGGSAPDPYISSQSHARHDQGSSPPNVISWPRPELNSLHTLCRYRPTSVLRWAGWATVRYGRVGKLKIRVGKRKKIFGALRRILSKMFAHPGLKPCRRPW